MNYTDNAFIFRGTFWGVRQLSQKNIYLVITKIISDDSISFILKVFWTLLFWVTPYFPLLLKKAKVPPISNFEWDYLFFSKNKIRFFNYNKKIIFTKVQGQSSFLFDSELFLRTTYPQLKDLAPEIFYTDQVNLSFVEELLKSSPSKKLSLEFILEISKSLHENIKVEKSIRLFDYVEELEKEMMQKAYWKPQNGFEYVNLSLFFKKNNFEIPLSWNHGDLCRKNILISNQKKTGFALVDWEYSRVTNRYYDLIFAIMTEGQQNNSEPLDIFFQSNFDLGGFDERLRDFQFRLAILYLSILERITFEIKRLEIKKVSQQTIIETINFWLNQLHNYCKKYAC